jgi:hypothetical protein
VLVRPPAILQIVREPLKAGHEAEFSAIEEERARISVGLGCPNPYLGTESLTGPKEAWWFNGYESAEHQQRVYDAYAKNTTLLAAFQQSEPRKARITGKPIEVFARYRPDLRPDASWTPGVGRFLVVTTTTKDSDVAGTVFEAADGMGIIVLPTHSRADADAASARAGANTVVLAVRPTWTFPSPEWIANDPAFWKPPA